MKEAGGMIVSDNDARRPELTAQRPTSGWTSLHSWIFLAVVAVGLLIVGIQNRYHYLSPLGLGKAYRIDKLFGGIQEFDPAQGWVKAQLQASALPPTMSMLPPQSPGSQAVPMNMPGTLPPPGTGIQPSVSQTPEPEEEKEEVTTSVTVEDLAAQKPGARKPPVESPAESTASLPEVAGITPSRVPELSNEEKFAAFKKRFQDFGKDEFQLANDDLYPNWKKNQKPNGTWQEFLAVYGNFIQWWADAGSPAESGMTLWNKFLESSGKN